MIIKVLLNLFQMKWVRMPNGIKLELESRDVRIKPWPWSLCHTLLLQCLSIPLQTWEWEPAKYLDILSKMPSSYLLIMTYTAYSNATYLGNTYARLHLYIDVFTSDVGVNAIANVNEPSPAKLKYCNSL